MTLNDSEWLEWPFYVTFVMIRLAFDYYYFVTT